MADQTCPDPIFHRTHRYCPYCAWTEPADTSDQGRRDLIAEGHAFLSAAEETPSVEIFIRDGLTVYEQMLRGAPDLVRALLARIAELEPQAGRRVIETVEELDALPNASAIIIDRIAFQKFGGWWHSGREATPLHSEQLIDLYDGAAATMLWQPEVNRG